MTFTLLRCFSNGLRDSLKSKSLPSLAGVQHRGAVRHVDRSEPGLHIGSGRPERVCAGSMNPATAKHRHPPSQEGASGQMLFVMKFIASLCLLNSFERVGCSLYPQLWTKIVPPGIPCDGTNGRHIVIVGLRPVEHQQLLDHVLANVRILHQCIPRLSAPVKRSHRRGRPEASIEIRIHRPQRPTPSKFSREASRVHQLMTALHGSSCGAGSCVLVPSRPRRPRPAFTFSGNGGTLAWQWRASHEIFEDPARDTEKSLCGHRQEASLAEQSASWIVLKAHTTEVAAVNVECHSA